MQCHRALHRWKACVLFSSFEETHFKPEAGYVCHAGFLSFWYPAEIICWWSIAIQLTFFTLVYYTGFGTLDSLEFDDVIKMSFYRMLIGNVSISNWSVEESDHSQKTSLEWERQKKEKTINCAKNTKSQIHVESRSIQNDQIKHSNILKIILVFFFWNDKWMKTNCLYIKRNWERKNGGLKSGNKLKIIKNFEKL